MLGRSKNFLVLFSGAKNSIYTIDPEKDQNAPLVLNHLQLLEEVNNSAGFFLNISLLPNISTVSHTNLLHSNRSTSLTVETLQDLFLGLTVIGITLSEQHRLNVLANQTARHYPKLIAVICIWCRSRAELIM